jgi:flagellar motility protein MotE (MotC chaperone)
MTGTRRTIHHERRPTHFLNKYKEEEEHNHELLKGITLAVNYMDTEEVIQLKQQAAKLLADLKESKKGCEEIATMWKRERDEKRELEEAYNEIENEIKHHKNMNKKITHIINQSNEFALTSPRSPFKK